VHFVTPTGEKGTGIKLRLELEGKKCTFDLDTGATESVISHHQYKALGLPQNLIQSTNIRLKAYNGESIPLRGVAMVNVEFQKRKEQLPLYVVDIPAMALFGMKWVKRFGWEEVFSASQESWSSGSIFQLEVADLLNRHLQLFDLSRRPAIMKTPPISLHLKPDHTPKYFKSRPVPIALQQRLKEELQDLQQKGIISPIQYSKWASQVVVVLRDPAARM
jgi:predicted aspartyl protease